MLEVSENWKPFLLEPEHVETLQHLLATIHPGRLVQLYKSFFKNPHNPKSMRWLGVPLSKTRAEHVIEGVATLLEHHPDVIEFLVDGWLDSLFASPEEQSFEIDRHTPHFHIVIARLNAHSPSPMPEASSWKYIEDMAKQILDRKTDLSQEVGLRQKVEHLSKDAEKSQHKAEQESRENKRLQKQLETLKTKTKNLEDNLTDLQKNDSRWQARLETRTKELEQTKKDYAERLDNSDREKQSLTARLETLHQEKTSESAVLQNKLNLLQQELNESKTQQLEESRYQRELESLPEPDYSESTATYQVASGELHGLVTQVETVTSKRNAQHYALLLRRYDHLLQKLQAGQYSEKSGNWLKAELKALYETVRLAIEHELTHKSLELPDNSDFCNALAIDYDLLGKDAFERMTTLLDLYEEYRAGSDEKLKEKTNWSTLEGEAEGLLLLGLESFLTDCLNLPIRRYLKLSSFKSESLVMALSQTIERQRIAS